ncbi:putative cation-transporting P-type ATPase [Parachlamydia acanthamoebae UV-7]|uniref:Putative cation-transporting P-type ATPase n=1 Tax=Parachlamydia acanthamoebae (strain UV7) TaxID=765952 RepID=F8KZ98_PARAV|nr:heavy metal translocating P-type ATPase [Parachlamydia acanthamoebae]CCB86230.1 putative cation-transporting P-type ATPase [Parachlamydia acanthamoebae UV-7]
MENFSEKDPVCGMTVDQQYAAGQLTHAGKAYLFCSKLCLEKFKQNPEKYLGKTLKNTQAKLYTCPMHPEIEQDHPGSCPICGMALEPKMFTVEEENSELHDMQMRFWISLLFTIPLFLIAMGGMFFSSYFSSWIFRFLQFVLSLPVILWGCWPFFERGWQSFKTWNLNMFSLISLGIGAAFLYSVMALFFPSLFPENLHHHGETPLYFETATTITVLVLLGQVFELRARSKTSRAIQTLLGKAAKTAWLIKDGNETEIPVDDVQKGDILRIKPGDKVPVDGVIIEGKSVFNEAMMTGEPIPVEKSVHDALLAGTINQTGSVLMRAVKIGKETQLAKIVQMVAEAQRSRAPIQSLADQIARYFVPLVILISFLTFICWYTWGPQPAFIYGLLNAVAVLIIACPCALGLATPMSIMVGIGRGAEEGILIRNAAALEKLEKVQTIVVDKTGTLTEGKPLLDQVFAVGAWKERDLLYLVAGLEQNSEHPLAEAIVQGAKRRSIPIAKSDDFVSETGRGIKGKVDASDILVGNLPFLKENSIQNLPLLEELEQRTEGNETLLYVAVDGLAAGLLSVVDPIKSTTQQAVSELHRMGKKIVMLSGDRLKTAKTVADQLNIDVVRAEISPDEKQIYVKNQQSKDNHVAMAGDGINDAPALAAADVGIAMGTGTDVAMESADVTLISGDLLGIAKSIRLSQTIMQNIKQNLFFAFIYNALGIPLAAGILYPFTGWLLNPIVAAFAMSLSSISVIFNALRLNHWK